MMTELELRTYFAACELRIIILEQRFLELRYNHNHDSKGRFTFSSGGGAFPNGKNTEKTKIVLTDFLNDDTIEDKEKAFRQAIRDGRVNTKIEDSQQQKHQVTKAWKNQVKQAMQSGGRQTPKSLLDKSIDPQKFVDTYAGTGRIQFPNSKTVVHEFITLPFNVGKTFDRNSGKYLHTNVIQIKYTNNGIHIFPTISKGERT